MKKGMYAILMAVLVLSVGLMGCTTEPGEDENGTLKISNEVGINETITAVYVWRLTDSADSPYKGDKTANIANGTSKSYTIEPGTYVLGVETDLYDNDAGKIVITKGQTTSVKWTLRGLEGDIIADTVAVTSVSVSPSTLNLTVGATGNLTATVNPSNATDKTVTWTSSALSVATVYGGVVTAVSPGTATITAASSNGKYDTATVTVTAAKGTLKVLNDVGSALNENINYIKIGNSDADTTVNLSNGQFKEYSLDPGTYTVQVKTDLATDKSLSVTITAGQTKTVALTLTAFEGRALGSRLRLVELD